MTKIQQNRSRGLPSRFIIIWNFGTTSGDCTTLDEDLVIVHVDASLN